VSIQLKLVADAPDEVLRACSTCRQGKPLTEFPSNGKGTLKTRCKTCHAAATRDYVGRNRAVVNEKKRRASLAHPEKHVDWMARNGDRHRAATAEYMRRYLDEHRVEQLLANAYNRAIAKGVPFSLTKADVVIPEVCPVLGIPLRTGKRGFSDNSPTLDRVVPSLGYVPGNIAVISGRANMIKRDATADELERIAAWMRSRGAK
jgi:hypothetical protein